MSKVNQPLIQTVFTKEQPNHNFIQQCMRMTVDDHFSLLGTTHNTLLICLSQGKDKGLEKILEGQKNLAELLCNLRGSWALKNMAKLFTVSISLCI